jgi:CDP-diacylglycerol--glycerol-3-phosphate 3-phosphatidyltransferase
MPGEDEAVAMTQGSDTGSGEALTGSRAWLASGSHRPRLEPVLNPANVISMVRTVAAVVLAGLALVEQSMPLLIAAYLTYWVGDIADGMVARARDEETRHGAVLDVVCDRACTTLCAAAFLVLRPEMLVPLVVFLLQFTVLDTLLTLGFLHWTLLGPNDVHLVDRPLWLVNWSRPAKAANTAGVVLLAVTGAVVAATVFAVAIAVLKVWSLRRLVSLIALRDRQEAVALTGSGSPA